MNGYVGYTNSARLAENSPNSVVTQVAKLAYGIAAFDCGYSDCDLGRCCLDDEPDINGKTLGLHLISVSSTNTTLFCPEKIGVVLGLTLKSRLPHCLIAFLG